ncbi:MAG: hypothetical protein IH586_19435, partial [Anaerolineaceae bacterium]|nr:hypothetical protein [Anaerolineaceae bacterium]
MGISAFSFSVYPLRSIRPAGWLEDFLNRQALLADGLHSCSEHIQAKTARDMHETCDITDHTWALGLDFYYRNVINDVHRYDHRHHLHYHHRRHARGPGRRAVSQDPGRSDAARAVAYVVAGRLPGAVLSLVGG